MLSPVKFNGGDEENRTPDPLLARQVLSQLSYAPIGINCKPCYGGDKEDRTPDLLHAMQALSQLSYAPRLSSYLSACCYQQIIL